MKIKEVLKRIEQDNTNVFLSIERLRECYKRNAEEHKTVTAEARGYLIGLKQMNFITERERQVLFCYITL